MRLYAIAVSTYSAKVRIALGVKGIDYEMVPPPGASFSCWRGAASSCSPRGGRKAAGQLALSPL